MPPPVEDLTPAGAGAPAAPPSRAAGWSRGFWWLGLGVVLADQIVKVWVRATLDLYDSVTVIPGLLDFTHVRNTGVAFGLLNSYDFPYKGPVTMLLALAALGGIAYYARHVRAEERLTRAGLSLILGGAVGNLVDRASQGHVTDFVDAYWGQWHFWAFNVADASISIGAVLVFADLLVVSRHVSRSV